MNNLNLYLSLAFGLITSIGYSQKQFNQWRFAFGSGISFNTTPPSAVTGSATFTQEGSASVADPKTGLLLFYTDGVTVWNSLNQVMPNGSNLTGGSMRSSTTAAVIIPKPGSSTLYYIVTIDEGATITNSNGVRYTIVDMTLEAGLGDVISSEKNIPLFLTSSERLEVVPAANNIDYWIITHDATTFASFLLSSAGLSPTPVLSTVSGNLSNTAGHLKINRQYTQLACGSFFENSMRLFKFNNATGVVSDLVSWTLPSGFTLVYGIEFSPNGEYIYISDLLLLYQYSLKQLNKVSIESSAYQIITGAFSSPASLQLGPDKKIYVNAGGKLDVITCPNNDRASCNYQSTSLFSGGYGLPKWVYNIDDTIKIKPNSIVFTDSCLSNTTRFTLSDTTGIVNVNWLFGDATSGAGNTAAGIKVSHVFTQTGSFKVRAIVTNSCGKDTLFTNVSIINCSIICTGTIKSTSDSCQKADRYFSIVSDSAVFSVKWDFGDPASGASNSSVEFSPMYKFSAAGNYQITAIVTFSCGIDTVKKTIRVVACDTAVAVCKLDIPNIFTPNSDSLNDSFYPLPSCETEVYEFIIYNRWGQQLFATNNPSDKWDGKTHGNECPDGVYIYLLKYKFNGQKPVFVNGTVTLLR